MQIDQIGIALRTALARRRAYNKVTAELSTYTERELAELGLCRSDIPALAREAAEQAVIPTSPVALPPRLHLARVA